MKFTILSDVGVKAGIYAPPAEINADGARCSKESGVYTSGWQDQFSAWTLYQTCFPYPAQDLPCLPHFRSLKMGEVAEGRRGSLCLLKKLKQDIQDGKDKPC